MIAMLPTTLGQLSAHPMVEKLSLSVPEIILFIATVIVMVVGLSPKTSIRQACGWIAGIALLISGIAALLSPANPSAMLPQFMPFAKTLIAARWASECATKAYPQS